MRAERGERAARPAGPQPQPMTSVLIQLVSTKPYSEDLRKGLINSIGKSSHGGETETAAAPATEAGEKAAPVSGDLWGQVEKMGTQAKEKTEGANK